MLIHSLEIRVRPADQRPGEQKNIPVKYRVPGSLIRYYKWFIPEYDDISTCLRRYTTYLYSGRDEKIGKKDQQDDLGSEVEREALWKKIELV